MTFVWCHIVQYMALSLRKSVCSIDYWQYITCETLIILMFKTREKWTISNINFNFSLALNSLCIVININFLKHASKYLIKSTSYLNLIMIYEWSFKVWRELSVWVMPRRSSKQLNNCTRKCKNSKRNEIAFYQIIYPWKCRL